MEIISSVRHTFGFIRNSSEGFESAVDGKEKKECFLSSSINLLSNAEAMITHENLILRRRKILSMVPILFPALSLPFFLGVPALFANDQSDQPSKTMETMETMETLEEPRECRNGGIVSGG